MNFEQNSALPKRFVTSYLPWLVGLGALLLYLTTMSRGATFSSINLVAKTSGWVWQPDLHQPLAFLLFYPFRWLPEQVVPIALNVFNAVIASLVLVLVARAVALLPHDRTSDQREINDDRHGLFSDSMSWVPPVFAALVLGLHISFWECATSVSGDMIDALVLAYVIRCLLEFRVERRPSWIFRSAFIFAAGMTNNWAMVALAPFFLMAVIWIKGVSFFNGRFIVTLFLSGIAGLLFYIVLPLVNMGAQTQVPFSQGFVAAFKVQQQALSFMTSFFKYNRHFFLALASTSVLPLFFISLRWRPSFGDTSPIGIFIAKAVFHLVHAVLLVVCLVAVMSPAFSPRQMLPGMPFLNHALLLAIAIGYCAGYFLLISKPPESRSRRRTPSMVRIMAQVCRVGVLILVVLGPVALIARNWHTIQSTNGKLLNSFLALTVRDLPDKANVICDDPGRLALTRSYLVQAGKASGKLFYDTQSGQWSDYHVAQLSSQGERWPSMFATLTNRAQISPLGLIAFLSELVSSSPTYYLEPSFGYYFERFELKPEGMVYRTLPCPTNSLFTEVITGDVVAQNQKFWSDFDEQFLPVIKPLVNPSAARKRPAWLQGLMDKFRLQGEKVPTANLLAIYASRIANTWGVELQKCNLWPEAAIAFERAITLSPDNIAAQVNLDYNKARQAGEPAPEVGVSVEDQFGRYSDWNQVMGACGPFDQPRFTFEQGRTFFGSRLYLQSIRAIKRVTELNSTNFVARIWLADLYNLMRGPTRALELVQEMRTNPDSYRLDDQRNLNLSRVEATALLSLGKKDQAKAVLQDTLKRPLVGDQFREVAANLYLQAGMHGEAILLLQQLVAEKPEEVRSLANLGYAYLQTEKHAQAEDVLSRAIQLDPENGVIRLNRAIVRLRAKNYDQAAQDYELLQQQFPKAYQVWYGLGEIAAARNDLTTAESHFTECMKFTTPGTPDYLQVSNRLATLRSDKK